MPTRSRRSSPAPRRRSLFPHLEHPSPLEVASRHLAGAYEAGPEVFAVANVLYRGVLAAVVSAARRTEAAEEPRQ